MVDKLVKQSVFCLEVKRWLSGKNSGSARTAGTGTMILSSRASNVGKASLRHGKRQPTVARNAGISNLLMAGGIPASAEFAGSKKGVNDGVRGFSTGRGQAGVPATI